MSLAPQIAPSGMSRHEGIVLGLLVLIVGIRLLESGRIPAAWSAVFGAGGGNPGQTQAPGPAQVSPGGAPLTNGVQNAPGGPQSYTPAPNATGGTQGGGYVVTPWGTKVA